MVEMTNAIVVGVKRPVQFFHMPVPRPRTDDAYFAPLKDLRLHPETELYLGLIHHDDAAGELAHPPPDCCCQPSPPLRYTLPSESA